MLKPAGLKLFMQRRFANISSSVRKSTCPHPKAAIMQREEFKPEYKIEGKLHSWGMINIPCIQLYMNLIYIYSEE